MNITYPDDIFSERELMEMWNTHHKEKNEFIMRRDRGHLPDVQRGEGTYFVAFDGKKPIGYIGWKDNNNHYIGSGVRVLPEYRNEGIAAKLIEKRTEKLDKPTVVIYTELDPRWINHWRRRGWIPLDEASDILSPETINTYKEYEDRLLVHKSDAMSKAWNIVCKFTEKEARAFMECD